LFTELKKENVDIQNVILKTNMILPGIDSGVVASPLEVANATLRVFRDSLPSDLPGVVFLSGGQSYDDSVEYLDKIVDLSIDDKWDLSFSYARSLQKDALRKWSGKKENVEKAQKVLIARLEKAIRAREGEL
jgi:fructose-bisphosphate aldolase class I